MQGAGLKNPQKASRDLLKTHRGRCVVQYFICCFFFLFCFPPLYVMFICAVASDRTLAPAFTFAFRTETKHEGEIRETSVDHS